MDDASFMKRALRLARRGAGYVEPNPMVGCVIARDGEIVGEGWHRRFGGAHAEVNALEQAGDRAEGATVYVTLEPCRHVGKTPPCVEALVAAKVRRVVIGALDPHPESGGGVARLEAAGIDVATGAGGAEAAELIAPFARRVATGLPWVIAKWAATIDGAIATATGDSQWISNTCSRRLVHQLRARVDAVMVGIGTAIADDPLLTAREVKVRRVARRVVIDPKWQLPASSRLMQSLDAAPLTLAVNKSVLAAREKQAAEWRERGVCFFALADEPDRDGLIKLRPLLKHLAGAHEATNVLVEGGAATVGALARRKLIDEAWVFIGPKLLGGGGLPALRLPTATKPYHEMKQAQSMRLTEMRRLGDDVWLRYRGASPA